jgi:hypothetical protein
MRHSRLLAFAFTLAVCALSGMARAQTKPDAYSYHFDDDELLGDTLSTPPPVLRGGLRPRRIMLLRPRASFVVEMLKSVEGM